PPHRERELVEAELVGGASALTEAEVRARALVATVKSLHVAGEPGRAVCYVAAGELVDLIVMRAGGRDQPPVGPRSLGPTARFVTDHSPCPVLLLRGRRYPLSSAPAPALLGGSAPLSSRQGGADVQRSATHRIQSRRRAWLH